LLKTADDITSRLQENAEDKPGEELTNRDLDETFHQLSQRFDEKHAGFGSAPKFPTPHQLLFLVRYWKRTGNQRALTMVEETLQAIRLGGIYDHLGYGMHRYSTDEKWFAPHFEKMLYDQALMVMALVETYQATGNDLYKIISEEIITYVLRDMTHEQGGFFSAEDADSEGREGKFYLWTPEELQSLLSPEDTELFRKIFHVIDDGNFHEGEHGENILYLDKFIPQLARDFSLPENELSQQLERIRKTLFEARKKRIHPYKDDKILTDWNGLMIAALAKAGQLFQSEPYIQSAAKASEFLAAQLTEKSGRLLHRYRDGSAEINGLVDDYAFYTWGLIELYTATYDSGYLKKAMELTDLQIAHFWDKKRGGFYNTADDGETLIVRKKSSYDGAIPSGNSVSMVNLVRLARYTANTDFESKAAELGKAFSRDIRQVPSGFTLMMTALDFALGPAYEIVIAGKSDDQYTRQMLKTVESKYLPKSVIIFNPEDESGIEIRKIATYLESQRSVTGKPTAYVCQDNVCHQPTNDTETMMKLLAE